MNYFLTPKKLNYFHHQTFNAKTQFMKWKKRAITNGRNAIHTQILEIDNFRDINHQRCYSEKRIKTLLEEDKIKSKISNNLNSYYINEDKINIEVTDSTYSWLPT